MQEVDVIYNRYGQPELRVLENGRLVTFRGESVGFIKDDSAYDYHGHHLGWYENGILRDNWGAVVGFGEQPTDYPIPLLPLKALKPLAGLVQLEPLRPLTQLKPLKPMKTFSWSAHTPIELFLS